MASSLNRKSASLGSRKQPKATRAPKQKAARATKTKPTRSAPRTSSARATKARSNSRMGQTAGRSSRIIQPAAMAKNSRSFGAGQPSRTTRNINTSRTPQVSSVRIGDIERTKRTARVKRRYRRYLVFLGVIAALISALAIGGVAVYNSSLFTIEEVNIKGVEHLTTEEMQALAGVPVGTTLLRVDAAGIKNSLLRDAWVEDVSVNRIFPNTLEISVTESSVAAIVEVPTQDAKSTQAWAIASDGMWLMPIPKAGTEAAARTSSTIYKDVEKTLHIVDVPYGTEAEVGQYCSDANVNNALAVVDGLTTELADRVTSVKATDPESTTLTIKDGPDIVFGTAENIREKERVCLEIMDKHPDGVAYINVRTVDRPTWRAL